MKRVRIHGMIVDLRKLDDDAIQFVRRNLDAPCEDIDALVERLQVLGKAWPALAVDLLVQHKNHERVIRLSHSWVTNQSRKDLKELAAELQRRRRYFRLPPNGYTQERLDEVNALAERRDPRSIPQLVEYLAYSTSGATLEQELRRATYDALTWYETNEVSALLLEALRTEPDEIAGAIVDVLWRQAAMIGELPSRIDAAWKPPRDERLAGRLLVALVKADDECVHKAWVHANYHPLLRTTGVRYE